MRIPFAMVVGLLLVTAPAGAQNVEVGAGLSVSCEALEYSLCHQRWGTVKALYVNWWITDSVAIEVRGARLDGPSSRIIAVGEEVSRHSWFYTSYALRDEHRTVVQASWVYQFLPAHVIRPFVGVGPGVLWWNGVSTCPADLIGCERVVPNGTPSRLDYTTVVVTVSGGVAFEASNGVTVRAGLRSAASRTDRQRQQRVSDLPRGLPEYFLSIGYRW